MVVIDSQGKDIGDKYAENDQADYKLFEVEKIQKNMRNQT
jgi:hypothetical protein